MKKKIIQLPKGYLSYSAIQLWKNDRKRYIQYYFNNDKSFSLENSGLKYGKIVAEALEHDRETGDLLTDAALLLLTKYDVRDQEIRVTIKTKHGSFDILGRPDTLNSVSKAFREYKSGKGAWTANKAQKHPQMIFYALLIYLKYGVAHTEAYLDWIQTEDTDDLINYPEGIKPTGHVETFRVTFTLADILTCMADTIRVAKEIELAWVAHIPPKKEPW